MRPVDAATLRLHYRGRLASCNFSCGYCPFAKRRDSAATLRRDAAELARFVDWALAAERPLAILFTPWGEGLIRRHYGEALVALSHAPHVRRVAIQTNLSAPLRWLPRAERESLALWCSYHPEQLSRRRLQRRLAELRAAGVRFSLGMVGAPDQLAEIEAVHALLQPGEYLWINALDPRPAGGYGTELIARFSAIDPHFPINLDPPSSQGAACRAGSALLAVDGEGTLRPCLFVDRPLGNLYDGSWQAQHVRCPNPRCDCFIGYVHRRDLPLGAPFGEGVMERMWAG